MTLKKTMYNEMINTGVFYRLQDPELESSITEYYEIAEFELTKLNRDNQNHADYFLHPSQHKQKNLAFRLLRNRNLEYQDWSWLKDTNSEEYKELESRVIWFDYALSANQFVKLVMEIDNFLE